MRRFGVAWVVILAVSVMLLLTPFSAWSDVGSGLIVATSVADLATSEAALSRGGRELNPLLQGQVARYAVKAVGTTMIVVAHRKIRKRSRTLGWTFAATVAVAFTAMAVHNHGVAR